MRLFTYINQFLLVYDDYHRLDVNYNFYLLKSKSANSYSLSESMLCISLDLCHTNTSVLYSDTD